MNELFMPSETVGRTADEIASEYITLSIEREHMAAKARDSARAFGDQIKRMDEKLQTLRRQAESVTLPDISRVAR